MSDTLGIILVDHGSKRGAANDMLFDVVELFRKTIGVPIVEAAHMELAEPTISQAFDSCVAQGATTVVVHPYFLSPGRHSTRDIPQLVADAATAHPQVRYHVTQPLGLHEKIAQVIMERVQHCLKADFSCDGCENTLCRDSRHFATST